ncbi:nucleoside triphosphate pyrophosphatase [soil metagenome]
MLVLGSASPRRRELLGVILPAISFRVISPDVDESVLDEEAPSAYLTRVVREKARDISSRVEASERADVSAILCADTTVVVDGRILAKPGDDAEGTEMLRALSGRTHEVGTAFVLAAADGTPLHEETVLTRVTFRAVTAREITAYVESGEGRDKAGGYAIQGGAAPFVARIDGSPSNVVGLPLCELTLALTRLGLT